MSCLCLFYSFPAVFLGRPLPRLGVGSPFEGALACAIGLMGEDADTAVFLGRPLRRLAGGSSSRGALTGADDLALIMTWLALTGMAGAEVGTANFLGRPFPRLAGGSPSTVPLSGRFPELTRGPGSR